MVLATLDLKLSLCSQELFEYFFFPLVISKNGNTRFPHKLCRAYYAVMATATVLLQHGSQSDAQCCSLLMTLVGFKYFLWSHKMQVTLNSDIWKIGCFEITVHICKGIISLIFKGRIRRKTVLLPWTCDEYCFLTEEIEKLRSRTTEHRVTLLS